MRNRGNVYPNDEEGFQSWFNAFATAFALHAAALQLAGEVDEVEADRLFLNHVLDSNRLKQQNLSACIGTKNILLDGDDDGVVLSYPAAPVLASPAPAGVPGGLVDRLNALLNRIRNARGFTETVARALGMYQAPPGAVTEAYLAALIPVISVLLSGLKPLIRWTRARGTDGIRIQADYGAGWVAVIDDTRPDHLDNHALPPAGQAQVWRYRAIYLRDGEPVGNYGVVHELAVSGS